MIVLPAGSVVIGSPASEPSRNVDEGPQRGIAVAAFAVSRFEVTRGQYEAFVHATGRDIGGNCVTDRRQRGNWTEDANTTLRDPGFAQGPDHPVVCINWDEANSYIDWLNTRTGGGYRLLTEPEWEYAARGAVSVAPDRTIFPWGPDAAQGCEYANGFDQTALRRYADVIDPSAHRVFNPMECDDGWLNTAPVGSLAANGFGLHDMVDREESRFQAGLSSGSTVRMARIWRNKCLSQRIRRRKLQPAAASTGLAASPSLPAR